ncbi:hypothetical protein V5799_034483 [Amblyomma americanum]|uniref:GB1/RHD3-type G domain-containing protein n=1 Tax=Amblyomma americanum TaxID=6943 RepID=A0AAQ4DKB6_AMBAM
MANRVDNCRAVLILQVTSEKTIELNEDALTGILMADDVKDLPVVVISIAGAFRKGKSFILNFFLRYLRNGCKDDWLGDPTAPLEGFHWHRGYESDTKGIWVWHEAIQLPTPESMHKANARANHEVAVQSAMKDYVTRMNELCNEEQAPLTKSELTEAHDKSLKSAKQLFDSIPKIGGSTISKQYRARLTQDAKEWFKDYKEKNDLKRDMIKKKSGMSDLAGAGSAAAVAAIGLLPLGLPGEIVAIVPVVTRCAIATYKFFAKAKRFFSSRSKAKKQEKKEADQENEETLEEGDHYSDDEGTLEDEDQEDEQLQ